MAGNVLQFHIDEIDHIIDKFGLSDSSYSCVKNFFEQLIVYIYIRYINDEFTEDIFIELTDYIHNARYEALRAFYGVEPTHE